MENRERGGAKCKIAQSFAKNNPIDRCFYILTSDKDLFGRSRKNREYKV